MKREHRELTAAEWRSVTGKRPMVVRKIRPPAGKERAQFEQKRRHGEAGKQGEGVLT